MVSKIRTIGELSPDRSTCQCVFIRRHRVGLETAETRIGFLKKRIVERRTRSDDDTRENSTLPETANRDRKFDGITVTPKGQCGDSIASHYGSRRTDSSGHTSNGLLVGRLLWIIKTNEAIR